MKKTFKVKRENFGRYFFLRLKCIRKAFTVNVFTVVIYSLTRYGSVFDACTHFNPNLMSVCKAMSMRGRIDNTSFSS
jgi:hypothetical protein